MKSTTEDTISTYPEDWIHVYTDGSAFKATTNAGWGAWICFPNGSSTELFDACGATCSNYEAEIQGIQAALNHLQTAIQNNPSIKANIVIFTDSKSALQALESEDNDAEDVQEISDLAHKLTTSFDVRLVLQWIPGHTDIAGNDKADTLAKKRLTHRTTKQANNHHHH